MSEIPSCPKCGSNYTYEDGDSVTIIKDLKVKGSTSDLKKRYQG